MAIEVAQQAMEERVCFVAGGFIFPAHQGLGSSLQLCELRCATACAQQRCQMVRPSSPPLTRVP
jgi:hypothetical protein